MRDFSISVVDCRVAIVGEIDFATAPQIDVAFFSLASDVVVDCADVDFIDSAGFHAFDRGFEAATARGSAFSVSGLSGLATRIAQLFKLPYVGAPSDRVEPSVI